MPMCCIHSNKNVIMQTVAQFYALGSWNLCRNRSWERGGVKLDSRRNRSTNISLLFLLQIGRPWEILTVRTTWRGHRGKNISKVHKRKISTLRHTLTLLTPLVHRARGLWTSLSLRERLQRNTRRANNFTCKLLMIRLPNIFIH